MGTAFGIGSPGAYPVQTTPWGLASLAGQGIGAYPFTSQPYAIPSSNVLQTLQHTPHQLQQLLQLAYLQQQQLQQLLQLVPAQLQQVQYLLQLATQQLQQLQYHAQGQQFGQAVPGLSTSLPFGAPFIPVSAINVPFNPTHVM